MRIELVQVFFEGALKVDKKYVEQVILFLYTLCTCIQIENLGPIINESPGLSA